jgi:cytochrome c oxidase subunit 3
MWRAVRTGARHWLAVTVALGSVFLIGQGSEYISSQSLLGTAFFTLTSFHSLHLLAGIVLLSAMLVLSTKELGVAALYWYFVAAVWIAIFMVVYL